MRILTIPNWSFGRDTDLLRRFHETLESHSLTVHYLRSDVDHNRTVSAFSGADEAVYMALEQLCELAFDRIDLNHHMGVHPRIGALDVCPFLALPDQTLSRMGHDSSGRAVMTEQLLAGVEIFAARIAGRFDVPVFLYEKSERGRHEADLPSLRKGGFGGLADRNLNPDFGPTTAHKRLGVSVIGVRDFLVAINVNLGLTDPAFARSLAQRIRELRSAGDPRFLGVRALGLPLASIGQSQVSLSLTLPDLTPIDSILEWLFDEAVRKPCKVQGAELIGVIRARDMEGATRMLVRESQIITM